MPSQRRACVDDLVNRYGVSHRQACGAIKLPRSVYYYASKARDSTALLIRIKEMTTTRVHYGYRRVQVLLRREGFTDNHKRVDRLYRACGLSLRHYRPKRNKAAHLRQPKQRASKMNEIWSMDFVADALFDGRRLRTLPIVDNYTSECLAIDMGQNLKAEDVVRTLEQLRLVRGVPKTIKVDNVLNAKVESFNGRFRQECLNAHGFLSLDDAKGKIEAWRQYYNEERLHFCK